jgi:uncharacterized protein (DUF4415 family)
MKNGQPGAAERPDDDNPHLTRAELRRARPAAEVLPGLVGKMAANALLRRHRGRPTKADKKVNQTLRIDPDVLEAYRQQGKGWQARINQVLRDNMPTGQK